MKTTDLKRCIDMAEEKADECSGTHSLCLYSLVINAKSELEELVRLAKIGKPFNDLRIECEIAAKLLVEKQNACPHDHIEYDDQYEMRSRNMHCLDCSKSGSSEELEEDGKLNEEVNDLTTCL